MAEFIMEGGAGMKLEVFEDKVIINTLGLFSKKVKNSKTIPYTSIIAIDFKKPASENSSGYIKFRLLGGGEGYLGLINLFVGSEGNVSEFTFIGQIELAEKIKNYIEKQVIAKQKH